MEEKKFDKNVNRKIEKLELETRKIQRELTEIKITPETSKMFDDTSKKIYKQEDNTKKIVLYGIEEYKHEPEHELHIRLIEMFREKLHIDLLGYIEETRRIGKYNGKTRPLIVELLSKRMVRYILNQNKNLRNEKIAMSPLLNESEKKERKIMHDEMMSARRNGLYAIIRNNQLYIQGILIDRKSMTDQTQPTTTHEQEPTTNKEKASHSNQRNSFRARQTSDTTHRN